MTSEEKADYIRQWCERALSNYVTLEGTEHNSTWTEQAVQSLCEIMILVADDQIATRLAEAAWQRLWEEPPRKVYDVADIANGKCFPDGIGRVNADGSDLKPREFSPAGVTP